MDRACCTQLALATALSAAAAAPAHAVITASWADSASSAPDFVQNELEVFTSQDWVSAQLLVQLNAGEIHYVTQGVVPSLDPTLLVGAAGSTSLSFPSGGDPSDPLNSQIPLLESITNVGTAGDDGLGGSVTPVISLTTFDLTYFGPPSETDDITAGTPLTLAQMTTSDDAFGTWAIRLANTDNNDTLFANGFVFRGEFFDQGEQIPGDLDNDGDIDDADFGLAFANFTGPGGVGKTLADGDLDGDGDVDDADYGLLFAAFTGPFAAATVSVPEPGTAFLVLAATTAFLGRRRRFERRSEVFFRPITGVNCVGRQGLQATPFGLPQKSDILRD